MSTPKIYELELIDQNNELPIINNNEFVTKAYFINNGNYMRYAGNSYELNGPSSDIGWNKGGGEQLYKFTEIGVSKTKDNIYLGTLTNEIKVGNYIVYENDSFAIKIKDIKDKDTKNTITVSKRIDGTEEYIVSSISLKPRTFIQKGLNTITFGKLGRGGKTKRNKNARKSKTSRKHRRSRKHSKKHTK